jgi:hypothetical protein
MTNLDQFKYMGNGASNPLMQVNLNENHSHLDQVGGNPMVSVRW